MPDNIVEVEEEGVVTVDLPDEITDVNANLPPEPSDDSVVEVKPEQKPRVRETKAQLVDATEALHQAVKTAEDAKKAAEATAQAERRRAEDALRFAQQREEEARGYQTQVEDRELAIITNGVEAAKTALESATQEQQRAYEAGEFAQATAAGARMAKAAAALDRYETAKINYESRPQRQQPQRYEPQHQQPSNALEQYLSTVGTRAGAWLRLHPECVPPQFGGDGTAHAKAMQGHYGAIAKGYAEGSDDYFKTLEENIGYRTAASSAASVTTPAQAANEEPVVRRQQPTQQRQAMPSAPVTRDAPGPSGAPMSRTVRLTPQQQEIALISFSPRDKEPDDVYRKRAFSSYASELIKATIEGKIGRTTH